MKTKNYNLFTNKNLNKNDLVINLMIKAGFISKIDSGLYIYLPNGYILLSKIKKIIRDEMNKINFYEFYIPILQPDFILKNKINYFNQFIKTNIKNKNYILSPTNEEEFIYIFSNIIKSKKKFPIKLFQINNKFRNEVRNHNILRSYEFIMKDAYSLHKNYKCLDETYLNVYKSYINILNSLKIKFFITKQKYDNYINSNFSHEFYSLSYNNNKNYNLNNNDIEYINFDINKYNNSFIEIAHIFKIGEKKLFFKVNENLYINSYGIGISRIFYTLIEQNIINNKLILPYSISIFIVSIIIINFNNLKIYKFSNFLYKKLNENNIKVLLNNKKCSYGESINNSELLGIPIILILSENNLKKNNIEIKLRIKNEVHIINIKKILDFIINEIKSNFY
ncbi:aminoacyl--tRNA ligase-related protein [Candidatus Nardonella dryophthoridicola]|uniref:Proline--tRNA ligase n=1 Tax=endosymbiont of Rhynchophorus ferrugineus TaxID=1972133 RepID=A0A2Z5TP26_9GAMM|nr:aminoacyl--tRNA ligase-related protein [Candidatus Nardonella dryophthoridicola]QTJ62937.1 hypothetical protein JRY34_00310 [Candidatus Nardonella dryophthoridicola]BBA84989.1 proline--tRNA ligase [endosymbiont of Rhynchophorus ferrugineus]